MQASHADSTNEKVHVILRQQVYKMSMLYSGGGNYRTHLTLPLGGQSGSISCDRRLSGNLDRGYGNRPGLSGNSLRICAQKRIGINGGNMIWTAVMLQRDRALTGCNRMAAPTRGNGIGINRDTTTTTFASVRV